MNTSNQPILAPPAAEWRCPNCKSPSHVERHEARDPGNLPSHLHVLRTCTDCGIETDAGYVARPDVPATAAAEDGPRPRPRKPRSAKRASSKAAPRRGGKGRTSAR